MAAESKLEQWCREYAEEHGCHLVKWVAPGNRGVPDRILLGYRSVVFCEFKAPRGRLSTHQERWKQNLLRLDHHWRLIKTREQFIEAMGIENESG